MNDSADQMRTIMKPPVWASAGALAWGERDDASNTIPIFTPDGHWFTVDLGRVEAADESRPLCYFIAAADGPIKIGFSGNFAARLKTIQACSPVTLHVLATAEGSRELEAWYHARFAAHRLHGEWFDRHPDILAEIERLSA